MKQIILAAVFIFPTMSLAKDVETLRSKCLKDNHADSCYKIGNRLLKMDRKEDSSFYMEMACILDKEKACGKIADPIEDSTKSL